MMGLGYFRLDLTKGVVLDTYLKTESRRTSIGTRAVMRILDRMAILEI